MASGMTRRISSQRTKLKTYKPAAMNNPTRSPMGGSVAQCRGPNVRQEMSQSCKASNASHLCKSRPKPLLRSCSPVSSLFGISRPKQAMFPAQNAPLPFHSKNAKIDHKRFQCLSMIIAPFGKGVQRQLKRKKV